MVHAFCGAFDIMSHVYPQQIELWLGLKRHYIDTGIWCGFCLLQTKCIKLSQCDVLKTCILL